MQFQSLLFSVLLLNVFSYFTIRIRPKLFKTKLYRPMMWNIKLSILPFIVLLGNCLLAIIISYIGARTNIVFLFYFRNILFFIGLFIWMLALPNSGYLVTELNLSHREVDEVEVPIWYDIISMLSFALSGVVNTLANIVILQITFIVIVDPATITKSNQLLLFSSAIVINLLVSFGIYLGRAIRFNSWDIIHIKPFIMKLYEHFKQKGVFKETFLFVLFHAVFFMILYISFGIPFYFIS